MLPWVEFIEYPEVKSSWVKRLYFEYITCNRLSKVIKATHWVCLHDITANVKNSIDLFIATILHRSINI